MHHISLIQSLALVSSLCTYSYSAAVTWTDYLQKGLACRWNSQLELTDCYIWLELMLPAKASCSEVVVAWEHQAYGEWMYLALAMSNSLNQTKLVPTWLVASAKLRWFEAGYRLVRSWKATCNWQCLFSLCRHCQLQVVLFPPWILKFLCTSCLISTLPHAELSLDAGNVQIANNLRVAK